ncbi:MAG: lysophospholipid acyltransferase family protein [Candidatus Omnitrophica bacterium]|nr:lysophospholipid acyltransferase family protein [Candidatus Omnitrophota bacterium]
MNKEVGKNIQRKIGWFVLRASTCLTPFIPLSWNYFFGRVIGACMYYLLLRHRRNTLISLRIALPQLPESERRRIAKDSFVYMSQGSLELIYFLKKNCPGDAIRLEGKEFLDEALSRGKGIIGLNAHLGNFPLISLKLAQMGYKVNVVARPMRDEQAGEYIHRLRTATGVGTIFSYPRRECVNNIIRALRNNEIVIIQMDQNFGTGGVWVKFFNTLAATPVGPVVFALRTDASVLPVYIHREELGRHCIKILPPALLQVTDDKDETILLNTIKFTEIIEKWVREYPRQWSWLHRRWKSQPTEKMKQMRFRVQQ